jgi:hypothetical protein
MILAGLQQAGIDAGKLALTALGWVGVEEGMERAGWGELAEVGAGIGTAGVFAGVCKWSTFWLGNVSLAELLQTDFHGEPRGGR